MDSFLQEEKYANQDDEVAAVRAAWAAKNVVDKTKYAKIEAKVKHDVVRKAFLAEHPKSSGKDFEKWMLAEIKRIQEYPDTTITPCGRHLRSIEKELLTRSGGESEAEAEAPASGSEAPTTAGSESESEGSKGSKGKKGLAGRVTKLEVDMRELINAGSEGETGSKASGGSESSASSASSASSSGSPSSSGSSGTVSKDEREHFLVVCLFYFAVVVV